MAANSKKDDYVRDQLLGKAYVDFANKGDQVWKSKWGWQLEEYKLLNKTMEEYTKKSQLLKRVLVKEEEDPRQLGPVPDTTNHEYGYVAANPQFQLEKYGSVFKPLPLPEEYKIFHAS